MGEIINHGAKPLPDCPAVRMDRAFSPALRETILQWYDLSTGVAIKDAVSDFESHRIPGPAQARRRGASPGIQLPDAGHHEIRV